MSFREELIEAMADEIYDDWSGSDWARNAANRALDAALGFRRSEADSPRLAVVDQELQVNGEPLASWGKPLFSLHQEEAE